MQEISPAPTIPWTFQTQVKKPLKHYPHQELYHQQSLNVKHTDEPLQQPLQQPIQDRISSNEVPNIDSPRRSKNVGRMARLLFKLTNSKTAIVEAAKRGDAILVERLLDKGAAVDSKDWFTGRKLLGLAAANGNEAVVKRPQ